MKLIILEGFKNTMRVEERHYTNDDLDGYETVDGECHPLCWQCFNSKETMVVLKKIGGWYDEYLCLDCVKEILSVKER